ncbi:hypothetical protein NBE98_04420 [Clostridium swellfunianum]|uniref:hypothetical protein n=1 Tax=Clostridium swellfunianum TaxID=1367462 RepID=UPI00202ED565|nr:hypothetical protein [Clostridium swellfunianum]MCM0647625.1 hypothetical protein [Clostridium swellfunianum]
MLRTTSLAEALECLYLRKKAIVIVSDDKNKYDSEMYILTKLLQHQGVKLSVEDLEKGNYTSEQSVHVISASRKIKYYLKFVIY